MTRVAIITGAAQGIGRAIALRLAADGVDVAVNDIPSKQSTLDQLVHEIRGLGRRAVGIPGDVSRESEVEDMVQQVVDELGGLDIMVANAGIRHNEAGILDISEETFDKVLNINLKGVLYYYRAAAKQMIKQGRGGRIVAASSIWGIQGMPNNVAYVASKFGVRALTQTAALEWGQYGITVNAYAPGIIDTPMVEEAGGGPHGENLVNQLMKNAATKRAGQPEEIAGLVGFLVSEGASYVTGQTVGANGGLILT